MAENYEALGDGKQAVASWDQARRLADGPQPYAGLVSHELCEYPAEPKQLALDTTRNHLLPDGNGQIHVPDAPGLGMEVNLEALRPYVVDTEIRVGGKVIYRTPALTP